MPVTNKRIAFVGVGQTAVARQPAMSEHEYVIEACRIALDDAGIDPSRVDGLGIARYGGNVAGGPIAQGLGMKELRWEGGGSGPGGAGKVAQAIDAGRCSVALFCKVMSTTTQFAARAGGFGEIEVFEGPYGLTRGFERPGLELRRYMHKFGATKEQLGWLCVVQREHARMNPDAYFQNPLSMDDYLNSRMLADPMQLFDCDIPVNGAWACVMTADEIAKTLRHPPVYLIGWSEPPPSTLLGYLVQESDELPPVAVTLWKDTGMRPENIDIAMVYDGFSVLAPFWMEALGLVKRGEAFSFIEGGTRIRYTGELPVNTFGGSLSGGRSHGLGHINECVRQLRGTAGPRQVQGSPQFAVTTFALPPGGSAGILGRL